MTLNTICSICVDSHRPFCLLVLTTRFLAGRRTTKLTGAPVSDLEPWPKAVYHNDRGLLSWL